jgi:TolB-like protein
LNQGANQVTLTARDAAGNSTERRISITRRIPKALLLSERLRLAVLPFEEQMSALKTVFQDAFVHSLVRLQRFQVVERERLDLILQEQQLASTRLINQGTAVRLGRLTAAQAIVTGSLVQTSTGTEIVSQVIDSETGEILSVSDVYGEVLSLPAAKQLAQTLALKIQREFPLVDGVVLAKQKQIIFTDLNKEKLRVQKRILIYKDAPVHHPHNNLIVGFDHQVMGYGRVIQQDNRLSKVELLKDSNPSIKPGDKVITQ